ncbi:MAG: hypothetical protein GJU73_06395 [Ferrovum sp.]|uniref:hypothetical protein n=1 Tax=Ferrovum sp. TaxID=2609467 RepID=UPI00260B39FB|nr:hypothetical protein [Ferrovum sp.]MBW8067062.1 hypothetical protein [Ferrovum sp.]
MSRYYDITITPPGGGKAIKSWSSELSDGTFDPQSQNVIFDILAYDYATPMGASTISIEGVTIQDVGQAKSYTGMTLTVKGGMKHGLPLANPHQAGTLLTGQIWQSFGNWEGTNMTLDFVVLASPYTYDHPGNFVLNWRKGTAISNAISSMYAGAFGADVPTIINVSPNRVLPADHISHYHSLEQAAKAITNLTSGQFGPTDPGVILSIRGDGTLMADDYTQASNPVRLKFSDLVGQPVWIGPFEVQTKLVMRADISVPTLIEMPFDTTATPGFVITKASSFPSYTDQEAIFSGNFFVKSMRHVGDSRSPQGENWVTIVDAVSAGEIIG